MTQLGWEPLRYRRKTHILKFVNECIANFVWLHLVIAVKDLSPNWYCGPITGWAYNRDFTVFQYFLLKSGKGSPSLVSTNNII